MRIIEKKSITKIIYNKRQEFKEFFDFTNDI